MKSTNEMRQQGQPAAGGAKTTGKPPGKPADKPLEKNAERAAQQLALARLGHLQVGILEADIHAAQMMRRALSSFGITQTFLSRQSGEMREIIRDRPIDLLIMDWDCRPDNGLEMARFLRSPESPDRLLNILLTTSRTSPEDQRAAKDAGVNEVIAKPFTVRDLIMAITVMIDNPRPFILAPGYTGPCRRQEGEKPPPGVEDRRGKNTPVPVSREAAGEVFIDGRPRIIAPDYRLKTKLESTGTRMAGLENVLPQSEAAKRSGDFLQWMQNDLTTLRQMHQKLTEDPNQETRGFIERMASAAQSLRSRALTANYPFVARAAVSLSDFCQRYMNPQKSTHLWVVEKHIESLSAIVNGRVSGDTNPIGRELVEELRLLVRRFTAE